MKKSKPFTQFQYKKAQASYSSLISDCRKMDLYFDTPIGDIPPSGLPFPVFLHVLHTQLMRQGDFDLALSLVIGRYRSFASPRCVRSFKCRLASVGD